MTTSGKKTIHIDGNAFSDLQGFGLEVHAKLCPTIPYNADLDAFNDILVGGFGAFRIDEPIDLVWDDSAKSREVLGYETTATYFEKRLPHVHPTNLKRAKQRIDEAKLRKGKTLFDLYVDIIRLHPHISLKLN